MYKYRVVNSLDFYQASLKSLGHFYFQCILSSQWKAMTVNLWSLHCQLHRRFWRPVVRMWLAKSNNLFMLQDAPNHIFSTNMQSSGQPNNNAKTLFSTFHHLAPVFFATVTVLALVLLGNSRLNFHYYTQHEPKAYSEISLEVTAVTFHNFLCCANQLHWTAQYANIMQKISKRKFLQYCPR